MTRFFKDIVTDVVENLNSNSNDFDLNTNLLTTFLTVRLKISILKTINSENFEQKISLFESFL